MSFLNIIAMKNENENTKKVNPENKDEEQKHHTTWIGEIAGEIKEEIDHIDTDFPLSGGDESHPAVHHVPKAETKPEEEKKEEHHHQSWIGHVIEEIGEKIESLDADFPLSGGEEPHTVHHKDK